MSQPVPCAPKELKAKLELNAQGWAEIQTQLPVKGRSGGEARKDSGATSSAGLGLRPEVSPGLLGRVPCYCKEMHVTKCFSSSSIQFTAAVRGLKPPLTHAKPSISETFGNILLYILLTPLTPISQGETGLDATSR